MVSNQSPIPSELPHQSTASLSCGMWYVFNDGTNVIRAWGSTWLGLERIYFNDQLINHTDRLQRRQSYAFTAQNKDYRIQYLNHSHQRWQTECFLWCNGVKIAGWRCKRKKIVKIRPTLAHLYLGIAAGMIGGLFHLPAWYGLVFISLSMLVTLITTAKTNDFVFEKTLSTA